MAGHEVIRDTCLHTTSGVLPIQTLKLLSCYLQHHYTEGEQIVLSVKWTVQSSTSVGTAIFQ